MRHDAKAGAAWSIWITTGLPRYSYFASKVPTIVCIQLPRAGYCSRMKDISFSTTTILSYLQPRGLTMVGIAASGTSRSSESRPILHVECCTIKPEPSPTTVCAYPTYFKFRCRGLVLILEMQRAKQVEEWLRLNRATVGLSELLVSFRRMPNIIIEHTSRRDADLCVSSWSS